MKFMLLFFLIAQTHAASTKVEVQDAISSVRSLIAPLLPGKSKLRPKGTEDFRVDGCEKYNIDWMNVLLMRTSFTMNFKFKEGCDIEGSVSPMVFKPFPAELKLRNLKSYDKMVTQNTVTSSIESKPILNLELREGKLSGKLGMVRFEADYQVQLNPMNKDKVIEKNLGGVLRISEIYGVKVSIKEKIMVE